MYRNVFGEKVSRAKHKEMENAAKNRRELIAGGVYSRRDLMKLGLITGAGLLIPKSGLSARLGAPLPVMQAASPPIKPFVDPMPIMPIKQAVGRSSRKETKTAIRSHPREAGLGASLPFDCKNQGEQHVRFFKKKIAKFNCGGAGDRRSGLQGSSSDRSLWIWRSATEGGFKITEWNTCPF